MRIGSLQEIQKRLADDKSIYFADWPITSAQREACLQTLVQTVDALISLGANGSVEDATIVHRDCIERYNELDDGFICSIERDDLSGILYELGDLSGLDGAENWVDKWRDW